MESDKINLEHLNEVKLYLENEGCTLTHFTKKSEKIKFICKCGVAKERLFKDHKRGKNCKTCKTKILREKPTEEEIIDETGEIWKPVKGGWISNLGNAKNSLMEPLTLCQQKYRYFVAGKHQYASRLVAEAFQIENYELLNNSSYVVFHVDGDQSNNKLENLKIVSHSYVGSLVGGFFSKNYETMKEKKTINLNDLNDKEFKTIPELPQHIISKSGEIFSSNTGSSCTLSLSKIDKYYNFCTPGKTYKVHRLICYAFNPIEGKTCLEDYEKLQVNHKDGNTFNNNAENLEWVTQSENMFHSYATGLNKKVRNVLQYTKDKVFIAEYISIAEASRKSGEPEHRIREIAQGKKNSQAQYYWEFKNPEETLEYSRKYSSS